MKLKITHEGRDDVRSEIFNLLKDSDLQIVNFHQKDETLESIFRALTSDATEKTISKAGEAINEEGEVAQKTSEEQGTVKEQNESESKNEIDKGRQ